LAALMFTGIVTDVGEVVAVEPRNDVVRFDISCSYPPAEIALGASIACAGICLTAVAIAEQGGRTVFEVEAAPETLSLTTASGWQIGTRINLERSLKLGDELGGHLVSGHVDGTAEIVSLEDLGEAVRLGFRCDQELARFIAKKGSVALDGTSLTVNIVIDDGFDVLLIPHTLAVTTWGDRQVGDRVNLEIDTLARYVARLAETARPG
jgi:riboflavin synthase